jgi:two-component system response regulator YesN
MLGELGLPVDSIHEATTGEEMVSSASQYRPDIAFVDIRMPGLNGLDAIRAARPLSPQTKWYILTGFPQFDYAQEAIRLGVSGYLLKPVNPEELSKVIQESTEESRKKKIVQNKQFEHDLMALSYGLNSLEFEERDSFLLRARYLGAVIYIDSQLPEKIKAERESNLIQVFHGFMDECLDNRSRLALFFLPSGELAVVGAREPGPYSKNGGCVQNYFHLIEREIHQSAHKDLEITFLVSKECASFQQLQSSLEQLQEMAPLRVLCGTGKKLDSVILDQQAARPGSLELSRLVLALCHNFEERYYLNYVNSLEALEKYLHKSADLGWNFPRNSMAAFIKLSIGCDLPKDQSDKDWMTALHRYGDQLLNANPKDETQGADIIDQVTSFINENYMRNIGIGQIAEKFNITPNYLSTLFHKKTETTFMSYLKKVRMLRAKELLSNPNVQIQQVAEQVGYISSRYFAKLFSEYFGYLPSEYRDSFKEPPVH